MIMKKTTMMIRSLLENVVKNVSNSKDNNKGALFNNGFQNMQKTVTNPLTAWPQRSFFILH